MVTYGGEVDADGLEAAAFLAGAAGVGGHRPLGPLLQRHKKFFFEIFNDKMMI